MLPRFLATDLDPAEGTASVTGGEAHHLTRVMRLGPGAEVTVFDGRGREFRARVDRVAAGTVIVELAESVATPPDREVALTLAQAVLKGSSMDDVVRDATMMGVAGIVPLVTAHTVARRASAEHSADRWRRVALASVKQCRRARLPDVAEPVPFDAWLRQPPDGPRLLLVEPALDRLAPRPFRALAIDPPSSATLVVGPEGGWAADEVRNAIAAGHVPVTLGPLTLRADAVALAALAALTVVWD